MEKKSKTDKMTPAEQRRNEERIQRYEATVNREMALWIVAIFGALMGLLSIVSVALLEKDVESDHKLVVTDLINLDERLRDVEESPAIQFRPYCEVYDADDQCVLWKLMFTPPKKAAESAGGGGGGGPVEVPAE